MTPQARVAAACDILDAVLDGAPAEKTLTTWGRTHRFAGSSDRAAIRDLVFDALRRRRSLAWIGGDDTGRGLMIGHLRCNNMDPAAVFTGGGYAPASLASAETAPQPPLDSAPDPVRLDCPDWLWPVMQDSLGPDAAAVLGCLQSRAPVFLRVNSARTDRDRAARALSSEGIETRPHALGPTVLEVTGNPRRVQTSAAFRDGLVEIQDAASQAVVDFLLPRFRGKSVLDFCAGGGGKALALAAGGAARVVAHDANPGRMADIPARAARARAVIEITDCADGPFDAVLCDVPCSGSGAWRRQPDMKWRFGPRDLDALNRVQDSILDTAAGLIARDGVLAYATCSLIRAENEDRVAAFLERTPGWSCVALRRLTPLDGGDGFFAALLAHTSDV